MANIKHLQMWNDICTDARIGVSKSFFGLVTTAVYKPTNSIADARKAEFSPADGERLKRILESPRQELSKAIGDFRPQQIANGNFLAELCISRDKAFLAVQLSRFTNMTYEPATPVFVFEGDEAQLVGQLF